MQLRDYKAIVLTGGFKGRHKEENRPALETELDGLGNQGFELCWAGAVAPEGEGRARPDLQATDADRSKNADREAS